jgi:hypothetical protein
VHCEATDVPSADRPLNWPLRGKPNGDHPVPIIVAYHTHDLREDECLEAQTPVFLFVSFVTSMFLTYVHTHFLITSPSIKKHEKHIARSPGEEATKRQNR